MDSLGQCQNECAREAGDSASATGTGHIWEHFQEFQRNEGGAAP